jgi:NAD(P)-dependent dehydrogenase (short-subunit alcohol dehydrogenase family)
MSVLEGKVAVITGATSGIGECSARLFAREGARVVIAGRRQDKGDALARSLGTAASFIRTDVAVESEVKAMIEHAVENFGRLDCLFNNAGMPTQCWNIDDIDLELFDKAFSVHFRGVLAAIKYAVPIMSEQRSGSIINISSVNGSRAGLGGIDYSVGKAAVEHLTRCVAVQLGERGIRVNTISPGPIATGIFGKGVGLEHGAADQELDAAMAAMAAVLPRWQPLQRLGTAEDVAQAALFLASDASSLINGHNLVVDGGISVGWPVAVVREDLTAFRSAFSAARASRG